MAGWHSYETVEINGRIFVKLCSSEDIFEGRGKRFRFGDDLDMQIAVYRANDKLYFLNNICPHRHQDKMHKGIIRDLNVMCPEHGWTYSLVNGQNVIKKQGVKSLESYEIFEKDGVVYVEQPVFKIPKWRRSDLNNYE